MGGQGVAGKFAFAEDMGVIIAEWVVFAMDLDVISVGRS